VCEEWDLCAAAVPSGPVSTVKLNGSCPLEDTVAEPERSAPRAAASGTMEVLVSVTFPSVFHLRGHKSVYNRRPALSTPGPCVDGENLADLLRQQPDGALAKTLGTGLPLFVKFKPEIRVKGLAQLAGPR
jgi:hypothetical protein